SRRLAAEADGRFGFNRRPQTVLKPANVAAFVVPDVYPLAQGSFALRPLVRKYVFSSPCQSLPPRFGTALMTPPSAPPYSASKLLDLICTSSMKSIWKLLPTPPFWIFVVFTPSMR